MRRGGLLSTNDWDWSSSAAGPLAGGFSQFGAGEKCDMSCADKVNVGNVRPADQVDTTSGDEVPKVKVEKAPTDKAGERKDEL